MGKSIKYKGLSIAKTTEESSDWLSWGDFSVLKACA